MSNIFTSFLKELRAVGSERTVKTYKSMLESFLEWVKQEEKQVEDFDRQDVREFLEEKGWVNSSKNTFLQALKSWVDFRIDEIPVGQSLEEIRENRTREKQLRSIKKMKGYKTQSSEVETLNPKKLQYLLESSKPRKACLFYFYFYTGMRRGEIKHIEDIEWGINNQGVLNVVTEKTKGKRRIPFHHRAGEVIKKIYDEGWDDLHEETIGGFFREKQPAFDISLSTHTARRTFRTEMKNQGVEKLVVKKLLGHKIRDVTDSSYLKVDFDDLTKAMRENHYFSNIDVPYRRLL